MTDDGTSDEGRDDDRRDVNVGLGGLLGSIGDLIDALSDLETVEDASRSDADSLDRDSFTIDYNYDVSVGLGADGDRRGDRSRERPEPERTVDVDAQDDVDYAVDVREYDDEVVVSADLPGIDEAELDVSVQDDAGTLCISASGDVIERIPVDPQFSVTDVSFKNQILQIRLQPREDVDDE